MFPLYKWGGFGAASPSRVGGFWGVFNDGQNPPTLEGDVSKCPHWAGLAHDGGVDGCGVEV
jgi:hypothetical protein